MNNPRSFLSNVVKTYFNHLNSEVLDKIDDNDTLNSFINDVSVVVLTAASENGFIVFRHGLPIESKCYVAFVRRPATLITSENVSQTVTIQTVQDGPLASFYNTLLGVLVPFLQQNDQIVEPYLQQAAANLEAGLRRALNLGGEKDLIIANVSDEVSYWKTVADTQKHHHEREKAKAFLELLQPFEIELSGISLAGSGEIADVLDSGVTCLDELWRMEGYNYPTHRMVRLLSVVGDTLAMHVQKQVSALDIWRADFNSVQHILKSSISACEKWPKTVEELCTVWWGPTSERPWPEGPIQHEFCTKLGGKLRAVLQIRSVHRQLTRLLSSSEQKELATADLFRFFQGLQPGIWSPYTEDIWQAAAALFDQALQATEQRVAAKLRTQLTHLNANTLQLLQELRRYEELLKRPRIATELLAERDNLLGLLTEFVNGVDMSGEDKMPLLDMPAVVSNIYWARQIKAQMSEIADTNRECLSDLKGSDNLRQKTEAIIKELTEYENEEFDGWVREINNGIKSQALALSGDGNVLIMDGPMVTVNYSPRLGKLVREVQQLSVLGLKIPAKIQELYQKAGQFAKQANALEQIAHFHNTIGDRMIPSQRPMMLGAAHALEKLITSQNTVTWSDADQIDGYIASLQMAVETLSRQNNKLAFFHSQITQKVIQLMDTELIKQQAGWKSGIRDIRDMMAQVEEMKFSNMKSWRIHWDLQIYKALERQYQYSLADLHSNLPEIKVQLVYRQQKLQFQPPFEEIKMKYLGLIKRFINMPATFRGVSDNTSLFAIIIERNAHRFRMVFSESEQQFEKLEAVRLNWRRWVALGGSSLEQLAAQTLEKADDWDLNFRASKNFGQESAKLPCDDVKVGCITISMLPIRTEMELQNRRYWDALATSLQAAIHHRLSSVNTFIAESSASLNAPRHSMDQVAEAYSNHTQIISSSSEVLKTLEETIKMNKTLASWTKEKMESVAETAIKWEQFQGQLQNFENLIGRQVETMKMAVQGQTENLLSEAEKFRLRWEQIRPRDTDLQDATPQQLQRSLIIIREKKEEFEELKATEEKLTKEYEQFGLAPPELGPLNDLAADLDSCGAAWSFYEQFSSELDNLCAEDWILFRSKTYRLDDFVKNWESKLEGQEMTPLIVRLLREVQSYKSAVPLLKYVRGDAFSDRHWVELLSMLGVPQKPPESLTVGDLLNARVKILESEEALEELNGRASSEIAVRQALSELDAWELTATFSLAPQTDSNGSHISVVKDFGEVLGKMSDMQCVVQSLVRSGSGGLTDRAEAWEKKLLLLEECVKALNLVQRKWVYLEPIFGNGSFALEQPRFQRIDQDFRHIMANISEDSHVARLTRIPNLKQTLTTCMDQLGRCQAGLDQYLQGKRSSFPRFYFLGDDDLLELLGQASKEKVIQAHLKKLFAGIHSVTIEDGLLKSVQSLQGEVVVLKNPVKITNSIEEWLNALNVEVKYTLRALLTGCLQDNDPNSYPCQILCLAEAIRFADNCENAIKNRNLREFLKELQEKITSYSSTKVDWAENTVLAIKLKSLLVDAVHHMDIVEALIANNVSSADSWHWQKRLRFYQSKKGDALIRMADTEFLYSYEYQGTPAKLIRTPLTEKCFLTLTQAMRGGLGGNPYGPAGTGKTESVKALGALLGRQVLVFNCDEGIDVESMARIFVGLVKCGAWGCFDEFNRLEETTLSAVSMLIQPILAALRENRASMTLLGMEIEMDPNCGIFVTLNPAGQGYGGRQKLPDNLKALFRPVAMTAPDNLVIAQVSLLCDGYTYAKVIGRKLVELFDFCQHSLSQQDHYDWGLRALKTVLGSCGSLLREKQTKLTDEQELETAVEALRFNTLSKLTLADSIKFDQLVKDVFVGVQFVKSGFAELTTALNDSCTELGLEIIPKQLSKCVEVWEQMQQRMGVALVGPPAAGKSTILRLLRHALVKMGTSVETRYLNPKAMPRTQLLGVIDVDTRQWSEGVLTRCAAELAALPNDVRAWLICDGDVDPEWVESLNSVLDDNRLLTLPSGWRIQFGPNVNFLFETTDLTHASPATISRMGTIFLSEDAVDVKTTITSWLSKQSQEVSDFLSSYLYDILPPLLEFAIKCGGLSVPYVGTAILKSGLSMMHDVQCKAALTVGLIHGLGANMDLANRRKLASQVLELTGEYVPDSNGILNSYFNSERNRIDVYSDDIADPLASEDLVLTAIARRSAATLEHWLSLGCPILVCGPQGNGKGALVRHCIRKLGSAEVATIHCSSLTTPQQVLYKLRQHCVAAAGPLSRVYRPKSASSLVLYLKGLELCEPDKYGTNMLTAWLQQVVALGGFFDGDLEWSTLDNVQIVLSIACQGHKPSIRFSSQLLVYNYIGADSNNIKLVLMPQIASMCKEKHLSPSIRPSAILETIAQIFKEITNKFTPTLQRHYAFYPKLIKEWCKGVARHSTDEDVKSFLFAIVYEGLRIFGDRLVSEKDRNDLLSIFTTVLRSDWNAEDVVLEALNMFVVSTTGREKMEKLSAEEWSGLLTKGDTIAHGGESHACITNEALKIGGAVARAVSAPAGSVLLLGRPGTGRKMATRAVAAIHNARLITLNVIPNYTIKNFKTDLKTALLTAGVDGQPVILMVEDIEFAEPIILVMVSSLIRSGEVLGLYTSEELEAMVAPLVDAVASDGYTGLVTSYFSERVLCNLHVVLVVDFETKFFADCINKSTVFYTESDVVWCENLSKDTLISMSRNSLKDISENLDVTELSHLFSTLGKDFIRANATPRRYLACMSWFVKFYTSKRLQIVQLTEGLDAGVSKLTEARQTVDKLQRQAAEQEAKLAEKQSKATQALDMIGDTMRNANTQKGEMEQLKDETERKSVVLKDRKRAIELELAEVEPLIQEAKEAVGNIKNESLSEIRSLRAPPDVIRDILEGVLRLMGIQDTSWNSMKTFLAKRGVKEEIRTFDAHHISSENWKAAELVLGKRANSFDPSVAKRASAAAAPLAAWVKANVQYAKVVDKIRPLEREQAALEENLSTAEVQVGKLSTGLSEVDRKVAELKEQLNSYTREAAVIEVGLSRERERMAAAQDLVGKLQGEYSRWKQQLGELSIDLQNLPKDVFLAALFVNYLGEEPLTAREQYLSKWKTSLERTDFNLVKLLSSEQERSKFVAEGLPSDEHSIENAITMLNSLLTPRIVDPDGEATVWLIKHLGESCEVVSQNSLRFARTLELAVRFGKTLLVTDCEHVHAVLAPLLRRNIVTQGTRQIVTVGGTPLDFNSDFRLFLITRSTNFAPCYDTTTIDFSFSVPGLAGQLLIAAIEQERPDLGSQRSDLLRNKEILQKQLLNVQNNILQQLVSAKGDILENTELLKSLNTAKANSEEISSALEKSGVLEDQLNAECASYRQITDLASAVFFALHPLSSLSNLYRFSVQAFKEIFLRSLKENLKIENRKKTLVSMVYQYVARSLFEVNRLTFALHLARKCFTEAGSPQEWSLLVKDTISRSNKVNLPDWLEDEREEDVATLRDALPSVFDMLNLADNQWRNFARSASAEAELPEFVRANVSPLQTVLIIQAFRPDRLHSALTKFVCRILGINSLTPKNAYVAQLYEESKCAEPIILLTSPGADPGEEVSSLARKVGVALTEISLGQGQASNAISMLTTCATNGSWLLLKNCHLMTELMAELESVWQEVRPHTGFRLWLSTEPHQRFPTVLARSSLKLSYEAPPGIRKNLQRSYGSLSSGVLGSRGVVFARLLFTAAWFHAVVQERRSYIPQGWSKFYEFTDADLAASLDLLDRIFTSDSKGIKWDWICGLLEQSIYGGRIDSLHDQRVLVAYIRDYFTDATVSGRGCFKSMELPNSDSYADFLDLIHKMPETDSPATLGLAANMDRSRQKIVSAQAIAALKSLDSPPGDLNNLDANIWPEQLTPILNLWKNLHQGLSLLQVKVATLPVLDDADPVTSCVTRQFHLGLRLIQRMHKGLAAITKAMRGPQQPDTTGVRVAEALVQQRCPLEWIRVWAGPLDPRQYLHTVVSKTSALQKLLQTSILDSSVDLSVFFYPEALFKAVQQTTARKLSVALDELTISCTWDQNHSRSAVSCKITNLLIEGALLEGSQLVLASAIAPSVSVAPPLIVSYISKGVSDAASGVRIPLYRNSERQNLIVDLTVPSDVPPDQWCKSGAAFFAST